MSSTTIPNPPTFITASSGGTQATISWVVPIVNGGNEITSYTVTSTPIDGLTATVTGITNINSNTINSPGNLNFLNDNPFITLKTGKELIIKDTNNYIGFIDNNIKVYQQLDLSINGIIKFGNNNLLIKNGNSTVSGSGWVFNTDGDLLFKENTTKWSLKANGDFNISGSVTCGQINATDISGSSLTTTGAITGSSLSVSSGTVTCGQIKATDISSYSLTIGAGVSTITSGGDITGASLNVGITSTNILICGPIKATDISGSSLTTTGAITGSSLIASGAGNITTTTGNIITGTTTNIIKLEGSSGIISGKSINLGTTSANILICGPIKATDISGSSLTATGGITGSSLIASGAGNITTTTGNITTNGITLKGSDGSITGSSLIASGAGNISTTTGNITTSGITLKGSDGSITGSSLTTTGDITGSSLIASGAGNISTTTGNITTSGITLNGTNGSITGSSLTTTGDITGSSLIASGAGNISTTTGNITTSGITLKGSDGSITGSSLTTTGYIKVGTNLITLASTGIITAGNGTTNNITLNGTNGSITCNLISGSSLSTSGGRQMRVTEYTGTDTLKLDDHYITVSNNTGVTITLSVPTNPISGQQYYINAYNIINPCIISGTFIDNTGITVSSITMSQGQTILIVWSSVKSKWFVNFIGGTGGTGGTVVNPLTIMSASITDANGVGLDDTTAGDLSYVTITGTGYSTGAIAILGSVNAIATTVISQTTIRAQFTGILAGTYSLYVIVDGVTAVSPNSITYSLFPSFITTSIEPFTKTQFATRTIAATSDSTITYTATNLPPGISLYINGTLSGTIIDSPTFATLYSFIAIATDAELQNTSKTFTLIAGYYRDFATNATLTVLDSTGNVNTNETAVSSNGGYIKITANTSAFFVDSVVKIDTVTVSSLYISPTIIRVTVPATVEGSTRAIVVTNTDGSVLTNKTVIQWAPPVWTTVSGQLGADINKGYAFSRTVVATLTAGAGSVTYVAVSGFPTGVSINSTTGVISGPVIDGGSEIVTVSINAINANTLQSTTRSFTLNLLKILNIRINPTRDLTSSNSFGGLLDAYKTSMVFGANNSIYKNSTDFVVTKYMYGILAFTMLAGTYTWKAKSSSGSGPNHWTFVEATGTMTFPSNTDVMLLVPNNGSGPYSAGGGLFFVQGVVANLGTSPTVPLTDTNAILVIGGGGSGLNTVINSQGQVGPFTNNTDTAKIRRNAGAGTGLYTDGAGFLNTFIPTVYLDQIRAYNFVEGGAGGHFAGGIGGFGGGGAYCGGGGGYVGGISGSWATGGGSGGTSYYNTTYITSPPTIITSSALSSTERSSLDIPHAGYFEFTLI